MSFTAIALIAVAAVAHASWNLLSKQASQAGAIAFGWLMAALATAVYAPVTGVYLAVWRPHLAPGILVFVAGTAVLHVGYFVLQQRGYRYGELSLMYPLARGTGLMLSSFTAVLLYHEHPGPYGTAGILLVAAGVFTLSLPGRAAARRRSAGSELPLIGLGLATGVFIASYTLWDAYAVSRGGVPPLIEDAAAFAGQALLLTPLAVRSTERLSLLWHGYRKQVLGAAVLSPLAYLLVLIALVFSPVSSIAPAREVSVLFGVLLGRRLLGEGHSARRIAAAAAIAVGVTAIALG